MLNISRIGDIWMGVCCCHSGCVPMSGPVVTGSPNHISSSFQVTRLFDIVIGTCGHPGKIITASLTNFTNGRGKSSISRRVTGCTIGQLVTGNPIHNTL